MAANNYQSRYAQLVFFDRGHEIKSVLINQPQVTIGRRKPGSKCDVLLDSELVSSQHGIFNYYRGEYYYTDCVNVNGTYLNGKKVKLHGVKRTNRTSNKENGTILGLSSDGVDVALNGRILALTALQMEGKGKVSAKEFMNGAGRNSIGQRFTGVKE